MNDKRGNGKEITAKLKIPTSRLLIIIIIKLLKPKNIDARMGKRGLHFFIGICSFKLTEVVFQL